jgi:hypothetical protein
MTYSRQEIVKVLHRAGMDEIAAAALATLPEHVDYKAADKFCAAHHLTLGFVVDRMGGSP